jgi:hypothetical protein
VVTPYLTWRSADDAVVTGELLGHMPPEQIYSTLCEFLRLPSLRGRLMMTTPNPR